mmetsp:Transcript_972/g.3475  ORF Transcript_972/g.3475 Transcript_972/m.3475 type:complete len:207 (+) Transcript_972:34-654(+)
MHSSRPRLGVPIRHFAEPAALGEFAERVVAGRFLRPQRRGRRPSGPGSEEARRRSGPRKPASPRKPDVIGVREIPSGRDPLCRRARSWTTRPRTSPRGRRRRPHSRPVAKKGLPRRNLLPRGASRRVSPASPVRQRPASKAQWRVPAPASAWPPWPPVRLPPWPVWPSKVLKTQPEPCPPCRFQTRRLPNRRRGPFGGCRVRRLSW